MKGRFLLAGILVVSVALWVSTGQAADFGLGAKFGTPGCGPEMSVRFSDEFTFRLGLSTFPEFEVYKSSVSGINYTVYLNLFNVGAYLDWHPIKSLRGFKVAGGLLYNGSTAKFEGQTAPGITYDIGGTKYTGAQLGKVKGDAKYNPVAPYLGVGYTHPLTDSGSWLLDFNVGVFYLGKASISMTADNPTGLNIQPALDREASRVRDKANQLEWYPNVSVGFIHMF